MTEPKFTSAPWIVKDTKFHFVVESEDGRCFVEIEKIFDEECKSNANLIAVAPDLYNALLNLVDICENANYEEHHDVIQAKEILAKARGEL